MLIWILYLKKIDTCHNNSENLLTIKINKHTTSGYLLFTYCSFDTTENKHDHYRGRDCMETFFIELRKHGAKTINDEKKRNDVINK